MPRSSTLVGLIVASTMLHGASGARAADAANPDWPCVQRKVEKLTSLQMWDGPAVDDLARSDDDEEMEKLNGWAEDKRRGIDRWSCGALQQRGDPRGSGLRRTRSSCPGSESDSRWLAG